MTLLLLEYLHAAPLAYRAASATMQAEGRAMLLAAGEDLAMTGCDFDVALCQAAHSRLPVPHKPSSSSAKCNASTRGFPYTKNMTLD